MTRSHTARARNVAALVLLSTVVLGVGTLAHAQSYPSRPVRIVVPFPPGGPLDLTTRLLAEKLTASLKQPFVVENRPGAAGNIGTASVAKASGDGYTLLLVLDTPLTVNPWLYAKLPFEPVQDFAPISTVASFSLMLVAHPSMTVNTVAEFVAHARARKDRPLIYGSGGAPGSPGHLAMEYLRMQAGFPGVHVPHKGNAEVVISLVGGQVEVRFPGNTGGSSERARRPVEGVRRLQPPAHAAGTRCPDDGGERLSRVRGEVLPDDARSGIHAGTDTRRPRTRGPAAMQSPDVREKLRVQDLEPIGSTGAETKDLIKTTGERWRSVIKSANIRSRLTSQAGVRDASVTASPTLSLARACH